ncbi:DHS-like NAD/FAD-binding domain-containing protein [Leucogyrophana mollusca]|uniref:DHS-like NAD/FAD-binding domain-containing protein n=1 Tax=Leucogyrophana mollusca TaxID=85980 RepID=A0ACB8B5Q1_9AGAM|nr:DHS-like NAD/FAD-binding domain-containing protein [Leucogyrophana mollusca]
MNSPPNEVQIQEFRRIFGESNHIIVVAGAGLSAASGIPTFRDGGGMWRSLDVTTLATPEAFKANPSLVWQFYHYRRVKALQAKPNKAHRILARLSEPHFLAKVAPKAKSFNLITQNVDRLSVTALKELAEELTTGATPSGRVRMDSVFEIHGKISDVKCTNPECEYLEEDLSIPLCSSLGIADTQLTDYQDAGTKEINIPEEDLPRCPKCGALARPGVVWAGERSLSWDIINQLVFKADMCLVIGTSLPVTPASTFPMRIRGRGANVGSGPGKVAVFNVEPTKADEHAHFVFHGPCDVELSRVFPELDVV